MHSNSHGRLIKDKLSQSENILLSVLPPSTQKASTQRDLLFRSGDDNRFFLETTGPKGDLSSPTRCTLIPIGPRSK